MAAEGVDLVGEGGRLVELGVAGGEEAVPEEGEFFLQLVAGGDHPVHPVGAGAVEFAHFGHIGVVAADDVVGHSPGIAGVQQVLNDVFVTAGHQLFQFVAAGTEAGAAHQVGHQGKVRSAHSCLR